MVFARHIIGLRTLQARHYPDATPAECEVCSAPHQVTSIHRCRNEGVQSISKIEETFEWTVARKSTLQSTRLHSAKREVEAVCLKGFRTTLSTSLRR